MRRRQRVTHAIRAGSGSRVHCDYCRRGSRVNLADRPQQELLAALANKLRCTWCHAVVGSSYLRFALGAELRSIQEKPIGFSGMVAVKIGMN